MCQYHEGMDQLSGTALCVRSMQPLHAHHQQITPQDASPCDFTALCICLHQTLCTNTCAYKLSSADYRSFFHNLATLLAWRYCSSSLRHCANRQGDSHSMRAMLWLLQAGISCADRVVTVSPGYAWEIQTPEGGWAMEGMLTSRSYALNGVLNGVDLVEWDPESDPHIYQNYGETSFTEGKRANKAGLQKEMGLPQRPEVLDCLVVFAAHIKLPRSCLHMFKPSLPLVQAVLQRLTSGPCDFNAANGHPCSFSLYC